MTNQFMLLSILEGFYIVLLWGIAASTITLRKRGTILGAVAGSCLTVWQLSHFAAEGLATVTTWAVFTFLSSLVAFLLVWSLLVPDRTQLQASKQQRLNYQLWRSWGIVIVVELAVYYGLTKGDALWVVVGRSLIYMLLWNVFCILTGIPSRSTCLSTTTAILLLLLSIGGAIYATSLTIGMGGVWPFISGIVGFNIVGLLMALVLHTVHCFWKARRYPGARWLIFKGLLFEPLERLLDQEADREP